MGRQPRFLLAGVVLAALWLAVLSLAGCAPAAKPAPVLSPAVQKEAELQREFFERAYYERRDRLDAVAFRLATANAPLCAQRGKARADLGLTAEYFNERDFKENYQALSRMWGVGEDTIVVTGVVPEGPAAKAGIRKGDIVTSFGVKRGPKGQPVNVTRALDMLSAKGPLVLGLLRAGKPLTVTIAAPVDVCDSNFLVMVGDKVNAFANGTQVIATFGLMNFFPKDEDLALVLGHELAHNVLGHVYRDASGKVVKTASPEQETEADAVGLYFTARAGFDIKDAPNVWRRLAAQNPAHISARGDHPSTAERFLDLEAVRDEIVARQAAGLPLVPKPRVAPEQ